MTKAYYCQKCWEEESDCRCANCTKCRKSIAPNEQYGDDRYPNCADCHDVMQALRQAEKQEELEMTNSTLKG